MDQRGQSGNVPQSNNRLESIDLLRGLLMIVMALDHVGLMVGRFHSAEMWAGPWTRYSSALPFLTRFVTHFCAPGFFFLMGVGMSLLAAARAKQNWSTARISRFIVVRGLLLILVSLLVEVPAFLTAIISAQAGPNPASADSLMPGMTEPRWVFTVLFALGTSMVVSGLLMTARSIVWAVLAAGAILGTALSTPGPADFSTDYSFLRTVLLISRWSHGVWSQYPIIPWFGIAALGVLFGRWMVADSRAALRSAPWIGLGAMLVAIILRAAGGFGNVRPPRDASWIEFLNFIKYPPALVFTLFMLGGNLIVLDLLERARPNATRLGQFVMVFGQAPLAFYLAHLWLFAIIGAVGFRRGTTYQVVYLIWLAGLIPLYWFTRWYRDFTRTKPADSVWRFF